MKRLGALKGSGKKGYYNFMPKDPKIHGDSAKGMKQPQIPSNVMNFIQRNPAVVKRALTKRTKLEDINWNDDAVESEIYKNHMIRIYQDDSPDDPRSWDNLGHMVAFHKRYDLGDKTDMKSDMFNGWDELHEYLENEKDAVVILPLYLFDHSGISMSTKDFGDRWDSGKIGYIYATKEDVRKEYGKVTEENISKAAKVLQGEVETYDQYISGDVYGYKVYNKNGDEIDSVWGFYGSKTAMTEARSVVDFDEAKEK